MAPVTNSGKLRVHDGTGTMSVPLHTGHGAPNPYPHQGNLPMSHMSMKDKKFPKSDASGRSKREGTSAQSLAPRGANGTIDPMKPQMTVRSLRKFKMPDSGQSQVGAFYSQIPKLARSRFISPIMSDTQQNPTPGGNLGSPRDTSRSNSGGSY
jgi:hypothetical protein